MRAAPGSPPGPVAVEDLRRGDPVLTADNGPQIIRWIGSMKLSARELAARPNIRPIRIRAGRPGRNVPTTDLTVSPQHRILIRSRIARNMFGVHEVLIAAKHLLELEGVEAVTDATEVEYFHMLFDRHEVVISNGGRTESLYVGPRALKSVSPAARNLPEGRQARNVVARHIRNGRPMVS